MLSRRFSSPQLISLSLRRQLLRRVERELESNRATDRGVSLPTRDVLVSQLPKNLVGEVNSVLDAACHWIERSTGKTVRCGEPFIITYEAGHQVKLARHTDTESGDDVTLLVALDEPEVDFVGGGTRFYPKHGNTILARPAAGAALAFPSTLEHEGVPITRGKRRLIAAFTKRLKTTVPPQDVASMRSRQEAAYLNVRFRRRAGLG